MNPEILLVEKNQIILARVLLKFNAPLRKYPKFGVYSYFMNSKKGIIVFDTGPRYAGLLNGKRLETNNISKIISSLKKLFPNKKIYQIILSHYHHDHSQNAPELQKWAEKEFNYIPSIRIHQDDVAGKRKLRPFPNELDKVFKRAGHLVWGMGKYLKDNELLQGSNFRIIHTPGHTPGMISVISHKYNVIIGGWWLSEKIKPVTKMVLKIANEDKKHFEFTKEKINNYKDYKIYTLHPSL